MAKNKPQGGGRRGAVRNRVQFRLPTGHYAKRNRQTGEILSIKADRTPYKGVVIERNPSPAMVTQALATARKARVSLPALPVRAAWHARPALTPTPLPIVEISGEERAAA